MFRLITATTRVQPLTALKQLALLALLVGSLAACAPGAFGSAGNVDPVAAELQNAAEIVYHRMELGRLELGKYTTTPLVDLTNLPEGATVTLIEYDVERGEFYTILLTSSRLPGASWRITERGVRRSTT